MNIKTNQEFRAMVDKLVDVAYKTKDEEFIAGIMWIENEAKRLGVDFYQMFIIVLQQHQNQERAKDWLANRQCQ